MSCFKEFIGCSNNLFFFKDNHLFYLIIHLVCRECYMMLINTYKNWLSIFKIPILNDMKDYSHNLFKIPHFDRRMFLRFFQHCFSSSLYHLRASSSLLAQFEYYQKTNRSVCYRGQDNASSF